MNHETLRFNPAAPRLRPMKDLEYFPSSGGIRRVQLYTSHTIFPTGPKTAVMVDGGIRQRAPELGDFLPGYDIEPEDITDLFKTHAHYDHKGALHYLPQSTITHLSETDARVVNGLVYSEGPLPRMLDRITHKKHAAVHREKLDIIDNNYVNTIGEITIRAVSMPGHTSGSLGYLIKRGFDENQPFDLYVGDALDVKRDGSIVNAASRFSADTQKSRQSIIDLANFIFEHELIVDKIIPSHSGATGYAALEEFRTATHH